MKNVIFLIAAASKHEYLHKKHGGFKYFKYSIPSWEYWCKKNNVELVIYDTPSDDEHIKHKPTWQRWFDVFNQLDKTNIEYNKIALIDACTIIRWDTPNFFDFVDNGEVNLFRSLENIRWVNESVTGYEDFFKSHYGDFKFDLKKYSSCGWQIFDKEHKVFLEKLKSFYYENYESEIKTLFLWKLATCRSLCRQFEKTRSWESVHLPPYFQNHSIGTD